MVSFWGFSINERKAVNINYTSAVLKEVSLWHFAHHLSDTKRLKWKDKHKGVRLSNLIPGGWRMSVSPFNSRFSLFKKEPKHITTRQAVWINKKQALQDIELNTRHHNLKEQAVEKMKNKKRNETKNKAELHTDRATEDKSTNQDDLTSEGKTTQYAQI